ncbi:MULTISPECIES: GntR family transcriptional regulator [unclassified Mycolicibacterium]|uniref:GntR family transcriptional regulator n=1 Tax=unclassified Mycolicibacterium TaxID=2636767 RepID=UPI0012DCE345|nr:MULTISPECIES: GntR family transcriptional regulator [unclassified Mycolicibacterium]MUL82245.1 GntR family transcriptional regulator [Mycolicibacterium sp. CBMA 329]MUL88011.1 GntR family transcriptional regulator [Mycolicibacterium sp. CBMA 331]MUM02342.1 GntR family transcriptional regulator [Mycolicibacterium sp. CBMA 334]MUM26347.1 GntR family transcriptional regulator [Mycolicibacterium sp. CBMA 295]MUM38308.1 GntR family transcriptional regulator [Mycolicibacterium sp. CBMA 247]
MADGQLELPPLPPSTGRRVEQVMEAVRSALDTGRMRAGVKYSVYQLSDALGVSRTPVRDALLRLEEVGLIRFEARQGFRILLPDPREIADIFAIRLALELPAVARAATVPDASLAARLHHRMELLHAAATAGDDHAFAEHDLLLHDHILEAAGNMRARGIVRNLRESTRLLGATTADRTRSLWDIDAEHRPVITAITDNRPEQAADAMRRHLTSTGSLLVAQAIRDQGAELDSATVWDDAVDHQHG